MRQQLASLHDVTLKIVLSNVATLEGAVVATRQTLTLPPGHLLEQKFGFHGVYDLLDDMIHCRNAFQLDLVIWTVYCAITHNGTVYGLDVAYHKF